MRQEVKLEPKWRHRIPEIWMPSRDEPIRRCLKREQVRIREVFVKSAQPHKFCRANPLNQLEKAAKATENERIRRVEDEKLRQAENLQQITHDLEELIKKRATLFERKKRLLRELEMLNEDKENNN